ncbi:gas vesicle protein K [Kitasatospora sp. MBT63]|uniref:gas vesicle protein K n=1 Tax=Kitasatospora sp. MBT63 TaxID=1444768 RepID=UPI00053B2C05|nr:gas vesicle protein K [Kitasatospora sp. MBT63]
MNPRDAGHGADHPGRTGSAGRTGPTARYAEISAAAGRAFRLLPAPGEDGRRPRDRQPHPARRINTDPENLERDLVQLVLTLVELLRQLMERQALHRVDAGDLSEEQEERLGATLMALHDRMDDLCARYGLNRADLNLDLGPLGSLLPPP